MNAEHLAGIGLDQCRFEKITQPLTPEFCRRRNYYQSPTYDYQPAAHHLRISAGDSIGSSSSSRDAVV